MTPKINNIIMPTMSSSYPIRSDLKQNNNSAAESKLSSPTNQQLTNRSPRASCKKDSSTNAHEAFCDVCFDASPAKPIEEVCKVFS